MYIVDNQQSESHFKIAKLLIEKGAKMDLGLLIRATTRGDFKMVKLLVDNLKKDEVNLVNE